MTKSYRLSFKGYDVSEALYRNREYIKVVLAVFGTVNIATMDWKVFLASLGIATGTLAFKLGIDALHFFFTEVEL